jgi:uncharacterized membrane protein YkvA (DUF1232 family)
MKFPLFSLYNWYRGLIRNPQTRLWVILGTVVYLFSPLDVAPDIIPFAGQIDDFLLISILFSELLQMQLFGNPENAETGSTGFNPFGPGFNQSPNPNAESKGTNPENKGKTVDVEAVTIEE